MNRVREEAIAELRHMVPAASPGHDAAAWLFDSCARGALQQHSDVDIAILRLIYTFEAVWRRASGFWWSGEA